MRLRWIILVALLAVAALAGATASYDATRDRQLAEVQLAIVGSDPRCRVV
jgi:hypothetical protein